MAKRAADGLEEFLGVVGDRIAAAEVAGLGETGLRVASKLHWCALRAYRQIHSDHLPPQAWSCRHPRRRRAGPVAWRRGTRRPGHRMTPTPASTINCVAHTRCASWPASPRSRHRLSSGAGRSWPRRADRGAAVGGRDEADEADALNRQIHFYRSTAQMGITQTPARTDAVMRKHHALARRLLDRQDDYLRFTTDLANTRPTTTDASPTSALSSSDRRCPVACAPSPEPNSSARYAAIYPPPPTTATTATTSSTPSSRADPGYPEPQ